MRNKFNNIIMDLFIYLFSFFVFLYSNQGHLQQKDLYTYFLLIYILSWALSSLLTRKFYHKDEFSILSIYRPYINSFFLMLGLVSASLFIFELTDISRMVILGSLLLSLVLELFYLRIRTKKPALESENLKLIISVKVFIVNFILLAWILFVTFILDIGIEDANKYHLLLIIGIFICWFASSIFFHQFFFTAKINYWRMFWSYIKSYIIFLALVLFMILMLRVESQSSQKIITSVVLYDFWSFVILSFFYVSRKPAKSDEVKTKLMKATELGEGETERIKLPKNGGKYSLKSPRVENQTFREKLENVYLKKFTSLFTSLQRNLDIDSIDVNRAVVLRSSDIYNVEVLPDNTLQLYMNLHEMNDIRRLNAYFIEVNKRLQQGGVFISKYEPIRHRQKRFLTRYPYIIAQIYYLMDFFWRRVTPKIPYLRKVYFALTKGRNRAISLAEGLGRLYFCGFEIIDIFDLDNFTYFVAKKSAEPLEDSNPSYGPLFKMRRIGKNGKEIFVYKFRTMHPYSEYLQSFIYEINKLDEGGKFRDDFRITNWGRVFRKLWIDEFPMFINLIKGDLKLVGVRPLSNHYMSLYTKELIEKRKEHKPGLVPPFYLDMPKTLEEIIESEMKYLCEYEKHPIITDVKYFFGAWYNILFKNARSA